MTHLNPTRLAVAMQGPQARPAQLRIAIALRLLLELFRVWRTRSHERSALFRAPQSVIRELSASGMDVGHEAAKPFWQR